MSSSEASGSGWFVALHALGRRVQYADRGGRQLGLRPVSAGIATWQASSAVLRDVSVFRRAAMTLSASLVAAGSFIARASWARGSRAAARPSVALCAR